MTMQRIAARNLFIFTESEIISRDLLVFATRIAVAVFRETAVEQRTENVAGVRATRAGNFFRRAGDDDAAAVFAAFWSKVDDSRQT